MGTKLSADQLVDLTNRKTCKYRVKRVDSHKDVILSSGWNGITNVHSVFEADVNANDENEAVRTAMLFFPPAFGSTRTWMVKCLAANSEGLEEYPGSSLHSSDVGALK